MEIIAVVIMLLAGGAVAGLALTAMSIARAESSRAASLSDAMPPRDAIAASILYHVVFAGGSSRDQALRLIRRQAGLASPVTFEIDLASWASSYAGVATPAERAELLETSVRLITRLGTPLPLRQYAALLDLAFGLGFQTDALARLRETYGFDYVDHAREGRPRSADRSGGAAPLFERQRRPSEELLQILGVDAGASAQQIGVAYRRLAAQHHPDRFHGSSPEMESAAAARFIEITRAYEELMALHRD